MWHSICQVRFGMMCWNLAATLEIFLRVFLKKHKLYNLIKKEIHIMTTTIKKHTNTLSLQLSFTSFLILKLLHDSLIINKIFRTGSNREVGP